MAKIYKTEKEVLTINLKTEVPIEQLPKGVSPQKSAILKISAYPAVWKWLHANYLRDDRRTIDNIIETAIQKAHEKIPQKRIKPVDKDDFDGAFACSANREDKIAKGNYHRGKNKLRHVVTDEIKDKARWLHWFFRFWKNRKTRPENVQSIYDGRKAEFGRATMDPTDMTYFCCQFYYKEKFDLGTTFPVRESFRTTYLNIGSINRRQNTEEEVMQLVEKPGHQLNIIAEICRKLQK